MTITKSRYYNRNTMFARYLTYAATAFWGIIVITKDGALPPEHYFLVNWIGEDFWGFIGIGAAIFMTYRTYHDEAPCVGGYILNFLICALWTKAVLHAAVASPDIQAFGIPASILTCVMSWISFGAIPRFRDQEVPEWSRFLRG